MSDKIKYPNLFAEFEELPKNKWEEMIRNDLRGKDYKNHIFWNSAEGFETDSFFVQNDLNDIMFHKTSPGVPPFTRGRTAKPGWIICEQLFERDPNEANSQIKNMIKAEAGSILIKTEASADDGMLGPDLTGTQIQSQSDFDTLFQMIDLNKLTPLFNSGMVTPAILAMYLNHLEKNQFDPNTCRALFFYDPFTWLAKHGSLPCKNQQIDQAIAELSGFNQYKTLSADGLFYHSAGASIIQEIGIVLAIGSEFLQRSAKNGRSVEDTAAAFHTRVSAGPLLFPEIAKLRALRTLWNNVVTAYDADSSESALHIHSMTSPWNKSFLDPYNNILRSATEALSAVIGGADFITIEPFDAQFRQPDNFSKRISRNVHHILKHEAHLSKVTDQAGGSYYVEKLTDKIAEKSWEFFQTIEKQGGIVKALEGRIIQSAITESREKKQKAFDTQQKSLIGVNKHPKHDEKLPATFFRSEFTDSLRKTDFELDDKVEKLIETLRLSFKNGASLGDVVSHFLKPQKQLFKPVEPVRLAKTIEEVRVAAEKFSEKENRKPKAALLLAGDKKMRKARASFSQNFLGCGGYELEEFTVDDNLEDTVNTILKNKPDIAVLCSSDAEYDSLVKPFCDAFSEPAPILVLAGYPADKIDEYRNAGIDFFIHRKANLVETLQQIHKQLNIIR